jgi:hypothetical protein
MARLFDKLGNIKDNAPAPRGEDVAEDHSESETKTN